MTETGWDYSTDLLVVGSGGGGMTAALAADDHGLAAMVIEKTSQVGGSTAMSGGAIWIPCNHYMREAGITDNPEDALTYLKTVTKGRRPENLLQAYIDSGRKMVKWLASSTSVRFVSLTKYPDYYPEQEGGRPGGRTLEGAEYDGSLLGDKLPRLRPPHPQELALGRVAFTAAEAQSVLFGGILQQIYAFLRILAYYINIPARIKYDKRDTRLTLGNALAGRLMHSIIRREIPMIVDTEATALVNEGDRVVGIEALRAGKPIRIEARKGVVLAAGGFAHNGEMRERYQRAPITAKWTAANPANTGDGIRLALEAGADLDLMDDAWWTPTTLVPGEELAWLLVIEKALPGSILVNTAGRRFTNEAAPYIDVVNGMYADHEENGGAIPAWLVMDRRCRANYPCGPLLPGKVHPEFTWRDEWRDGWIRKAASIGELADEIGVDRNNLIATVADFNEYARKGIDLDFGRGKSAYDRYYADPKVRPSPCLGPLDKAPYYAIPVWPGDLGTKGGVVTDEHARALTGEGAPIDGLYAVGNCSASIMGNTYPGAGGTIGPAMVFGYRAALHAAGVEA